MSEELDGLIVKLPSATRNMMVDADSRQESERKGGGDLRLRWTDVQDIAIELEERPSRRGCQLALHRSLEVGAGPARVR